MPDARAVLERSDRRRLTPHTLVDLDALVGELGRVQRQGFAIIDEELEIGLRSVAVPVITARGKVVAALNVGAQASRLTVDDMVRTILPQLLAVQADLRPLLA